MINPLLSIIVPVFNVEKYLEECIDSILDQTLQDWELILIDDGSSDKSGEICDKYAADDDRIIAIHTPNGGQSRARNKGLNIARGKYITFIDSDDFIIEEDILAHTVDILEKDNDCDIVQFAHSQYLNGELFKPFKKVNCTLHSAREYVENLDIATLKRNTTIIGVPWAKIFRQVLFSEIKFPDGMCYEDTYLLCDLFEITNGVRIIDEGGYVYRIREGSTTTGVQNPKKQADRIKMQLKVFETLMKYSDNRKLKGELFLAILNALSVYKASFPGDSGIESYEQKLYVLSKGRLLVFSHKSYLQSKVLKLIGIRGWTHLQSRRIRLKWRLEKNKQS